jgi:hypothetical protein
MTLCATPINAEIAGLIEDSAESKERGKNKMDKATKERLESEYYEQLERFKSEYIELCCMIGAHLDKVAEIEKRLKVLEALIAFYGELEKKGGKQ